MTTYLIACTFESEVRYAVPNAVERIGHERLPEPYRPKDFWVRDPARALQYATEAEARGEAQRLDAINPGWDVRVEAGRP